MDGLREQYLDVSGRRSRVFRGGPSGAATTVFVHGGTPGFTPFCSGAFIWGSVPARFAKSRDVLVVDLPGAGATAFGSEPLTLTILSKHVLGVLDSLGVKAADFVGHDLGALIGIDLALTNPARLRSLAIVASPTAAPTADGLDNLLLLSPPAPLWSRESQAWALDRLSYAYNHIDNALLDACVAAAQGAPHLDAARSMRDTHASVFAPSLARTKYALWEACRNDGVKVPTQIVWGSHDPTSSREQAFVLFTAIAKRQPAAHFHVINRAGNFPFREQPEAFHHVVSAFQDGVAIERLNSA